MGRCRLRRRPGRLRCSDCGGPAGCAAAIAAARGGARTLLLEREGYLGGATVMSLVCVILSTNGVDFQGIWHEWVHGLRRRRGVSAFRRSRSGISATVIPEVVKYVWDDLLSDAGVELLHHVYTCGAIVDAGVMRGIVAETKAGRRAIFARRTIDCTGDGLICHYAGVPWEQGDGLNKWAMSLTKVFRIANANKPEGWPNDAAMKKLDADLTAAIARGEYVSGPVTEKSRLLSYIRDWAWHMPEPRNELMSVLSRVLKADPLDPWDITRAEREGRATAWEAADVYRRFVPGCENSYLQDTSNHIGVRQSRRVRGRQTVTTRDAVDFVTYPDEVARSSWDIDVWPADSFSAPAVDRGSDEWQSRIERMRRGAYFSIRFGCLLPEGIDNLLMAGRCISAEHVAESSLRIQQTCQATGEAAGTAAAMSLEQNVAPSQLDARTLLARLERNRALVESAI